MSTEYGKKVGSALRAICQLHSDVSRLLQDLDGTIGKGKHSVFGNYSTRDLTYHVRAEFWMAEAVYRYYYSPDSEESGVVEGITIAFFDSKQHRIDEPILIVGRLHYEDKDNREIESKCKEWDVWDAFFGQHESCPELGIILQGTNMYDRVKSFKVMGTTLYSVQSTKGVEDLMDRVRKC